MWTHFAWPGRPLESELQAGRWPCHQASFTGAVARSVWPPAPLQRAGVGRGGGNLSPGPLLGPPASAEARGQPGRGRCRGPARLWAAGKGPGPPCCPGLARAPPKELWWPPAPPSCLSRGLSGMSQREEAGLIYDLVLPGGTSSTRTGPWRQLFPARLSLPCCLQAPRSAENRGRTRRNDWRGRTAATGALLVSRDSLTRANKVPEPPDPGWSAGQVPPPAPLGLYPIHTDSRALARPTQSFAEAEAENVNASLTMAGAAWRQRADAMGRPLPGVGQVALSLPHCPPFSIVLCSHQHVPSSACPICPCRSLNLLSCHKTLALWDLLPPKQVTSSRKSSLKPPCPQPSRPWFGAHLHSTAPALTPSEDPSLDYNCPVTCVTPSNIR
nr:uncharacterized protein LOC109729437 [Microcebus murinus]